MSPTPTLTAHWIWDIGDARPVNAYRIFRKTITLTDETSRTEIARICADTRYRLYVNGEYLTHGPAPSAPRLYAYDEVPITLLPGIENVITVIVNYIGDFAFFYYRNRGGFYFEMDSVVSDASWQVARCAPWLPDAPRISVQQGHCEYYDARLEPQGLWTGDLDASQWEPAAIVAPDSDGYWTQLEPRAIPLVRSYIRDTNIRLIEFGNGTPAPETEETTVAGRLTNEMVGPLLHGQIKRDASRVTLIPDGADFSLVYDFGEEVSGFFMLTFEGDAQADGVVVEIGYDEALRVGETPSGLKQDWGNISHLRYADQLILSAGTTRFENYAHRAFRYVRLAVRGLTSPLTLSRIAIRESTYDINWNGVFKCSDARLERIWEIGRRTLQLCMDDRYMDCPWRERAQWIGDAKVEALAAFYSFGDTLLHRRFLRQIGLSQYPEGRTDPVGPGEWYDHSPRAIPGFTAIWIHSLWDYWQLSGDISLATELMPHVLRALEWLGEYGTGEGGLLADVPGWNFTDWAPGLSHGNDKYCAPVNLFYMRALEVTSELAAAIGDQATSQEMSRRASVLSEAFDRLFWNPDLGYYSNASVDGTGGEEASQQANSLALLYRIGSEERRQIVLAHLLATEGLTQIGSPYFSFYLLSALYQYGRHDEAVAYIRKNWGMMMDAGATTWWEEYHGQSSLCHAWSVGPTIDMMTQILGVSSVTPGFAQIQIAPHLVDLTWAKGIVPLPQGDVAVTWQKSETEFTLHVSGPATSELRLIVPASVGSNITVNGETIDLATTTRLNNTSVALGLLPGGGYKVVVKG